MANRTGKGGFKKGQSGNPGGRPKSYAEMTAAYQELSEATRERLIWLRDNADSHAVQLGASKEINDRGWGRVPQAVVHATANEDDERFRAILRQTNGDYRRLPSGEDGGGEDTQ